ncbi:MAG: rSAM/selenodomain-associated transferase 1 [Cyclobacteriaceae bacterium]|jgi:rSAM/selenodomain-associated transferase 1
MNRRLIIFVKNLIPGAVKTRLAKDIGIMGALDVYKYLVEYTYEETKKIDVDKAVFYSEYIEIEDVFDASGAEEYELFIQKGNGLGERMSAAMDQSFDSYDKVVMIGSDCVELTDKDIEEAFTKLDDFDVVVGPAKDGGFYLLGTNKFYAELFEKKEYSHQNVLQELLDEVDDLDLKIHLMKMKNDIDTLKDLKDSDIEFEFVDDADAD